MAKTQMQIQKSALKAKAAHQDAKLHAACFGTPQMADGGEVTEPSTMGYANGGLVYMHRTKRYDQTGSPNMADGGLVGATVDAIKAHRAALDNAGTAAKPAAAPAPAAPVAPAMPVDPLTAQLEAAAKARAAAPPPPKKNIFGFSRGGAVRGPGGPTDDKIPALLSHGEYVLPADTVGAVGKDNLDKLKAATHTPAIVPQQNGMADGGLSFDQRLARSGDPSTGAASIMTPASTSGARAPKFGALLADGGSIPGYDVEEIPTIEGTDVKIPKVVGKAPPNAGMLAERAAAAAPAPVAPAAPAAEAAAPKNLFGRASSSIGRGADAVASAAGSTYGLARRAAGWAGKAALPIAGIAGAGEALNQSAAERAAFEASMTPAGVQNDPIRSATTNALGTLAKVGNVATFGLAGRAGDALAAGIDAAGTPDGHPLDAAVKAATATHEAPGTKNVAQSAPNVAQSATPEVAAYDSPTTQITRFGNSFAGVGAPGQGTGTGSPADLAAQDKIAGYRAELAKGPSMQWVRGLDGQMRREPVDNGSNAGTGANGFPNAPDFKTSPEADQARARVVELSTKLASMPVGTSGRRATMRSLAAQQGALSTLEGTDRERNTFAQAKFGKAAELAMHRQSLANQTLGYSVQAQGNKLNFDSKMAEVGNASHKQIVDEAQQRLGNSKDRLTDLAKADGMPPELYHIAGATRQFPGTDGKMHLYQDLDEGARAKANGFVQNQAAKMKARMDAGLPYSISDSDTNEDPGVLGWARSMIKGPADTIRFGSTQTGSFMTARPNKPATHEASAADASQRKARQ